MVYRFGDYRCQGLHITTTTEESKKIFSAPDPKIIIAGSGMMNGGRIVHHARHYLPDPNNTLLLVGYQAMGTLGRVIQSGANSVRIFGETIPVRATVDTISGFSGHKGSDQLIEFVESIHKNIEIVFVVMGESSSSEFLANRLRDQVAVNAVTPTEGEHVELYL